MGSLVGGGVCAVRALTRDPGSDGARSLARAWSGIEIVAGDLENRASLRAALRGCYGAFGLVPNASRPRSADAHGHNLINAVAGAEIEHLVLYTDPSADAELETYARSLELPATFVRAGPHLGDVVASLFAQRYADAR